MQLSGSRSRVAMTPGARLPKQVATAIPPTGRAGSGTEQGLDAAVCRVEGLPGVTVEPSPLRSYLRELAYQR